MLFEQIEALAPALLVAVARLHAVEAGLLEREPGAVLEVLEAHRDDGLMTGPAALVVPRVRHRKKLVRHDRAVDAAEPVLAPFGIAHAAAPPAADPQVALGLHDGVAG